MQEVDKKYSVVNPIDKQYDAVTKYWIPTCQAYPIRYKQPATTGARLRCQMHV